MIKAMILIGLALSYVLLPSCVAGGSSVGVKAKKNSSEIELKMDYSAFGGANLSKLNTCIVQFGSESSVQSKKLIAVETSRKRENVEWIASIPNPTKSSQLLVRLTFITEDLIGRNTTSDWIINTSKLTREYQLVAP